MCFYEPGRLERASQCNCIRSGGRHCVGSPRLSRLHNSLSDSLKSARYDYQAEKSNQTAIGNVIHSNPGSRFCNVIIGMISQLAHSNQQAIIPLFTHLHTHTHHALTYSLCWMRWQKKVLVFSSLPVIHSSCKFPPLS